MKRPSDANRLNPIVQGVILLLPFVGSIVRRRDPEQAFKAIEEIKTAWADLSPEDREHLQRCLPLWAVPETKEDAKKFLLGILNRNAAATQSGGEHGTSGG